MVTNCKPTLAWLSLIMFVVADGPHAMAQNEKRQNAERQSHDRAGVKRRAERRAAEFARLKGVARKNGNVPVIIKLSVPDIKALTTASVKAKKGVDGIQADVRLEAGIARVAQAELARLSGIEHGAVRVFKTIPFVALRTAMKALERLEASPTVLAIGEDHLGGTFLAETVNRSGTATGAAAEGTQGFDGSGWYVAVIDTGIRNTHEFFAGKDLVEVCFSWGESQLGDCPNGEDFETGAGAAAHHPFDPVGHGTHVAGIAVGKGPEGTAVNGVATGADLIALRVFGGWTDCDPEVAGDQPCVRTWFRDQINALEYVFLLRNVYNIASVNMSISAGANPNPGGTCDDLDERIGDLRPYKPVIDNLRAVGIATVAATGNSGQCENLGAPACISTVVSVGSTDHLDNEAGGSNYHPDLLDLFAPGVEVLSSVFTGDSDYGVLSGTSMAAPYVAGAWAILKQARPDASVSAVLGALKATGVPVCGRCKTRQFPRGESLDLEPQPNE